MVKSNQTNTKSKTKWYAICVILIGLLLLVAGGWYHQTTQNGYPDTVNFADRLNKLDNTSKQDTVIIFHKPGCSDCQKARTQIKQLIKSHPKTQYIVVNVNKPAAKMFVTKYGITEVPTIVRLQGQKVVDSTSATDDKNIQRVMTGV
ncbi:thioredoxin family protein [Leuconostoc citreum]|uniref:thioredoxin family protein n=1 Tax=Leuconostoc citreum TaxID=33964 RepID=UPI00200AA617|nr:thioredoxin family protein [Leuconostoc citreum]MCK8605670.1 thioredoxin family protein [Leuconostoc citreum]